ncbi:hypothetical protein [Streptomyces sp. NBC_00572]|uniref:hypothetical protein n=1 Tax=Streptomyces sp. NBC_00572 TaxID=2903664 RepID=UPI00224D411C|nr:hypothetical protein [Streptomyces sp. NBC_00572]MCX4982574.1 hypothetical protein [Streptomyces sp. NBC_00572]
MTSNLGPTAWSPGQQQPVVSGDVPDAHWWVAPLVGSLVSPLLLMATASGSMWGSAWFMLVGSLVCASAFLVPSWCLVRTRRRRPARIILAAIGAAAPVLFPSLVGAIGWIAFLVMLLTGNIQG